MFPLEPDLSVTLTILIIVVTINAINFIDGLDGLAAGIVALAALSFLVYSYTLNRTIGTTSQSVPAVASALLAGMCIGFLPHNFYPARIFMGDIGAMLLGLLLAYGPISSTDSLDPALLTNYAHTHALDRFAILLPLLMPAAIFIIPYADLMFAIIRRTRAGKPLMAADRQHLHHRLLNIGHSYRQSVLLMYLWAALFSVTVVSLSIVRSPSVVFAAATVVAVLALLPATMPSLRPWRAWARKKAAPVVAARAAASRPAAPAPDAPRYSAAAPSAIASSAIPPSGTAPSATTPSGTAVNGATPSGHGTRPGYSRDAGPFRDASPFPREAYPSDPSPVPADALPRAGRLPSADPFPGQNPFTVQDPFASQDPFTAQAGLPARTRSPARIRSPVRLLPRPGSVPRPGAVPRPAALLRSGRFTGQNPFPGPDPFPARAPFSSQGPAAPFPEAEARALSEEDPLVGRDPFPTDSAPRCAAQVATSRRTRLYLFFTFAWP